MSRSINAFFEIHINCKLESHTPLSLVSGILHCVEIPPASSATQTRFLPIAFYSDLHTSPSATSVNSLVSIRQHPFDYTAQNGLGATLDFTTKSARVLKDATGLHVTCSPPVDYVTYDISFAKLAFNPDAVVESVPTYNDLDSDVVLTTATMSAWTRPATSEESKVVIKSNVMEIVYASLYAQATDLSKSIILANESEGASAPSVIWTLSGEPRNESTGITAFSSQTLTGGHVDQMLDSIAPHLLQRHDTLDITVNVDDDAGRLYTASVKYTGDVESEKAAAYRGRLFGGLLDTNPDAYANKQAICIAVAKYIEGRAIDTIAHPPFQFSYMQCAKCMVLSDIIMDYELYYYVIYHFAPAPDSAVYSYPTLLSTTRGIPRVTLGQTLTLTCTFAENFPGSATASAVVTPRGQSAVECAATIVNGRTITFAHTVLFDAPHDGRIKVVYGNTHQTYTWRADTLTSAHIYTFPSSFAIVETSPFGVGITLKERTAGRLVLRFAGGDGLHSSVASTQVVYVKYAQGGVEVASDASGSTMRVVGCDASGGTVTLEGVAPGRVADLTLKVRLRAPDGTLSGELTRLVPLIQIAPEWAPIAAATVTTSTIPAPYKLVGGKPIWLVFSFYGTADFPATATYASSLFTLKVNGTPTDLSAAVVHPTNRTVSMWYTASGRSEQVFVFSSFYEVPYSFTITDDEFYRFPESVACSVSSDESGHGSVVTINREATLTWTFSSKLPTDATHAISSSGATFAPVTPSPLTANDADVVYKVRPTTKQNITPTLTVTFCGVSVTYTRTVLDASAVYVMPTGLVATVRILGTMATADDASITTLALGASYGTVAGESFCGAGNVSQIVLALSGLDTTINRSEVRPAAAVYCVDALSPSTVYGAMHAYTYDASGHSVSVDSYTLGTTVPRESFAVQFAVTVSAPDGFAATLLSQVFAVINVPTICTAGTISTSGYACVDGDTIAVPFALRTAVNVPLSASFNAQQSVASAIAAIHGPNLTFNPLSTTFAAVGTFTLGARYSGGVTGVATATLVMAQTRARVTCALPSFKYPTMISTTHPAVPVVTLGATLALTSTFSAALPSGMVAVARIVPILGTQVESRADVSGIYVLYSLHVLNDATHSGTVTLTLGTTLRSYPWATDVLTSAQIYTFPTGLSAAVRFAGASVTADDAAVSALALGARYGTSASIDLVCGEGNTTSIVLTLTGLDATTPHLSEVRPTAAVSCVDSSGTATTYGTIGTYTYDASGHSVDVGELTVDSSGVPTSGQVRFAVVVTAPDGLTAKLLSQAYPIISAPKTCVARAISTSGFTCVDGATIVVPFEFTSAMPAGMFAFGTDKSVASAIDTITGASPVIRFATLASAGNFSATGVFTLATTYETSGASPLELSATALLIMARTRARVTCAFVAYPFPAMVASVRLRADEVPVVTSGSTIALQSTFSAPLPSGLVATASIVPEGSDAIPAIGSVSGQAVSYSIVVEQDVAHSATVTLRLGTASRAYPWESVVIDSSSIYTFPTGLLAIVSFTSSNGATADSAVTALALGASYGSLVGLDARGDGNATSVVLQLEGHDASTPNTSEVASTGAVSCVDSNGGYGTMGAYTYDASGHSVSVGNYTVGTSAPGGAGTIQFTATVKAPDGATKTLSSQTLAVIGVPTTCIAGTIATSGYACIDGATLHVPFTLRSALSLGTLFHAGQSLESAVDSITSSSPILRFGTRASAGTFGGLGAFNLATTYNTRSPVQPIKRAVGFTVDSLASNLIVALPLDDFIDVSHEINPSTHLKTVETKGGSAFIATTDAKYYGGAMFATQGSSSILVKNMPLGYLSGDFTYEAWIRPTDNSRGGMSIFGSDPSGCGLCSSMLFSPGGQTAQVVIWVGQSASKRAASTTFPLTLHQWAHYALTKSGDVYTAYVDGTACISTTYSHPLTGYNQTLNIGGVAIRGDVDDFRGYMNDARVYTACKYDGNFIVGEAPTSATATLIMAKTRTRVTCAFPVFTFPATMESTTHLSTPVVTLGKVLALTSTFDAALPSGMTATVIIKPTGFASVSCNADVSGNRIAYSLAVLHDVAHSAVVTLTLGATSRSYGWAADVLTRAHIYTFPTGLSATVRFTGSSATVADLDVKALALDASYGTAASASTSSVCGSGNVSEILLTLTGYSTTTAPHASEVQRASDVYCVDSSGSSYGTMAGYTYRASEHSVSIDMFTLPGIMPTPASSAVQFAVIVTAPDGSTSTLLTSQSFHVTRTPVVTPGMISTSHYACVDGSTVPVPFTLSSGSTLQGLSVASAVDSIAGQGFRFESLYGVAFTSTGTFTLATTYEGGDASGVPIATLVMSNSRARVACALPAYTFPSTVTFSQPALVVGVDSTIGATMSAPGLDGMEWSVQASSGEVAASSGAFSGDETRQITFTYSPTLQVGATGSLSLSWAGFYRTIESTLAVASNISFVVQPLAYDGAVRNFKALTDSEITLTINDDTAMSLDASGDYLVTYSQTSPAPSSIYITSPDGSLPDVASIVDSSGVISASIVDSSGVILATIDSSGVISPSSIDSSGVMIERSISALLATYSQTSHRPTEIDEMIAAFQTALLGTESGNEVAAVAPTSTATFGTRSYPSMTLAPDALSSYLIVAFPANETVDVSHVINPQTTPKTVVMTDGSGSTATLTFETTNAKYYGRALYNTVGRKLVFVQDLPAAYLAGDFTYEAWIRPTDNRRGGMSIFGSDPFSCGVCSAIWFAKTDDLTYEPLAQVALRVGQRPWVVSSTHPVAIDEWSHYALTKRRSVYKVYINGTTCVTTTETAQLGNYSTKLNVGGVGARLYRPGVATPGLIVLDASGSRVLDEADEFLGCMNDVRAYTTCKYNGDFGYLLPPKTVTKTAKARVASSSTLVVTISPDLFEPMQITTEVATSYGTVKTLVSNVPTRDFYSFIQPTLISRITQVDGYYTGDRVYAGVPMQMAMHLTPVDGTPGATAVLYQASSMSPSAVHTKITDASGVTGAGVLTATCSFPTAGAWYIYALVTSPTGIVASNKVVCTSPVVVTDYTIPTTMTYSAATAVRVGVASTVDLTFARLYYGHPPSIASAYTSVTYTQPSSASCPSIYVTSSTGAKVGGVASDPFAGWLVLAIPGNALVDVSYSVNPTSTTKTVTAFGATTSDVRVMLYDKSMHVPGWNATTGRNTGIKVTGMPPGFLNGDWTVEGWFYLTSTGAALFNLGKCTDPMNISNTLTNPTVRLIVENSVNSWIEVSSGYYYQARFDSSVFTTNQWTHVALVRRASPGDRGAFSLYVGGSVVSLTVKLATGTRPVGDPGTTMFIGGNDDTNTNTCNMAGYVQDVRFYVASKYTADFAPVSALPVVKTATLVSSTATMMRVTINPDYRDIIALSVALKGPGTSTGTATCTTSMLDVEPATAAATTVSARYLRITLFYAGGDGTSGPAFAKLGAYSQTSDAYEDTGVSAQNVARAATFIAVSGGGADSNTPGAMRACIDDTRTAWTASTTGAVFQATSASGPAYYTMDLGAVRTIGALRFGEVTYESADASLFSARLEASTDSASWDLAHLVNAHGNETQRSVHSGYTLAPPAPTRCVGESLVLAVVSRAYQPTGFAFPTVLGAVSGALHEGRMGALRVLLPVESEGTRGATAVVAHSASASDASPVVCGAGTFDASGLSATVTPTIAGSVYLYIKVSAPGGGATASAFVVKGPVSVAPLVRPTQVAISEGALVFGASRTLTLSFADGSGNAAGLPGTSVSDAVSCVLVTQATTPIWATDSSGLAKVITRWTDVAGTVRTGTVWPDELGRALLAALPLDSAEVVNVSALAGGEEQSTLCVACVGSVVASTSVWRYYGRSVVFNGSNTGIRLTGLAPTCLQADWTVECWVYSSQLTSPCAVFGVVDASGSVLIKAIFRHITRDVSVYASGPDGLLERVTSTSTIGIRKWVHLAVVHYQGSLVLYVDGASTRTGPSTGLYFNTTTIASLTLGQNGVDGERWKGNMTDVRIYTTAKYTANFQAPFATTSVALASIARVGFTLQVPITTVSYRRATLFVRANTSMGGAVVEMSTTTVPVAYVDPRTVTTASISSAYRTSPTSVVFNVHPFDASNVARSVSMFVVDASGVAGVVNAPLLVGFGTLDTSGVLRAPSCVFTKVGTFTWLAKVTGPEWTVHYATSVDRLTVSVSDYPLPTSMLLSATNLPYNAITSRFLITLGGPNTDALTEASIAASIVVPTDGGGASQAVRASMISYNAPTGLITLNIEPTPTFSGATTLYITIKATPVNATTTTTLARTLTISPLVLSVMSGSLVYGSSRTLAFSLRDRSTNQVGAVTFAGTSVVDAVSRVCFSQGTAPIWATDSSGNARANFGWTDVGGQARNSAAWQDDLGDALIAALPLDTSGVVVDVRALAGGMSGALDVACSGAVASSTSVWRHYGRSVAFNGVDTSVRLTGLPVTLMRSDWTIECWACVSPQASSTSAAFGVLDAGGSVILKIVVQPTAVVAVHALNSTGSLVVASTSSISLGSWVHLAVVASGGTVGLYVNGVAAVASTTAIGSSYTTRSVASLTIGHNGLGGERWTGNMSDFRIYSTAKYTSSFSANPTEINLTSITRDGHELRVPITATSYRGARVYMWVNLPDNRDTVQMLATVTPVAYVYPLAVTSISASLAFCQVPTSVVFTVWPYDATNAAKTIAMYLVDVAGGTSTTSSPVFIGQGTLDTLGNATIPSCVFPVPGGAFTFYAKATNPEGAEQGGYAASTSPLSILVTYTSPVNQMAGLTLWFDGADPLGTGVVPADGAELTTWVDKSWVGRTVSGAKFDASGSTKKDATVYTYMRAVYRRNAQAGNGAVLFDETQPGVGDYPLYKVPISNFPSSAYTIFCVFFARSGTMLSASVGELLSIYMQYSRFGTITGNGVGRYNDFNNGGDISNQPRDNSLAMNIGNTWTVGTMVVNGATCYPFVNSIAQSSRIGTTGAFNDVVIGGDTLARPGLSGMIAEVVVYTGALDSTNRLLVEASLGKKWCTWPYNVSPLWNVGAWPTVGMGFGSEYDGFLGGGWGSAVYWMWVASVYDTTLIDMGNQGYSKPGTFEGINGACIPYILNCPNITNFYDDKSPDSQIWAYRWGYKEGQMPTHIALGTNGGNVPSDAMFTLKGFQSAAFTNGTTLATLTGDAYRYSIAAPWLGTQAMALGYKWNALTTVMRCTHFEFRQIAGPQLNGYSQRILLGRGNLSDVTGLGSVARGNLVCWLDGSDPLATGEAPLDGMDIRVWFDKSGNSRNGEPSVETASPNTWPNKHTQIYTRAATAGIGGSSGVITIPVQNTVGGWIATHVRVNFQSSQFPFAAYSICVLCNISPVNPVATGVCVVYPTSQGFLYFGSVKNSFQVYNNWWTGTGYPSPSNLKTMTENGSYVPMHGRWMFLCMTYESSTIVPYANGIKLKTIANAPQFVSTAHPQPYMHLFGNYSNHEATGQLAEFAVYNRVLSAREVSDMATSVATKYGVVLGQPMASAIVRSVALVYPPSGSTTTLSHFNGIRDTGDYIHLGSLTVGTEYTIECVFKPLSIDNHRNVCDMNYPSGNVGPRFELWDPSWVWSNPAGGPHHASRVSNAQLSVGAWYYTAFTMKNRAVYTYLNGKPSDDTPYVYSTNGYPTTLGSINLGRGFNQERYFSGSMRSFKIYTRVLTAAEVKQNYESFEQLPSRVAIGACTLRTGSASGASTLVLSGPNVGMLSAANISVKVGDDVATVAAYATDTGTIEFSVTPRSIGRAVVYVVLASPFAGSTTRVHLFTTVMVSNVEARVVIDNGATSDASGVLGLAAGRTYTSEVTLTLQGDIASVAPTGAVSVTINNALVDGAVASYVYQPATQKVVVTSMTLGAQLGALRFGVAVTTSSGVITTLFSTGHTAYAVPDSVSIATFGGRALLPAMETVTQFTFSHTNPAIDAAIGSLGAGASASSVTVASTATTALSATFSTSKVLGATVSASIATHAFTFTFAPTRTTATVVVPASAFYAWPSALRSLTSGALSIGTPTTCTIVVDGSGWSAASNTMGDFSVQLVSRGAPTPSTPGSAPLNCSVTGYQATTGTLQFTVAPDLGGSCAFVVFVRSGGGTGVLSPSGPIVDGTVLNIPITLALRYLTAQRFAKTNTYERRSEVTDFSAEFKSAYIPADGTCDMRTFQYAVGADERISWKNAWDGRGKEIYLSGGGGYSTPVVAALRAYTNIHRTIKDFAVGNPGPLGNIANGGADALIRYMWKFTTATLVDALMFYTATPGWQSEFIKFEIVASNDGQNFVRLPTEWSVSGVDTIEDTFHLRYDRKNKGGAHTFLFVDDMTPVVSNTSSENISALAVLVTSTGVKPIIGSVTFVNQTKYVYYGLGNVGSDTPYSNQDWTETTKRDFARRPLSDSSYGSDHKMPLTWFASDHPHTWARALLRPEQLMLAKMPWMAHQQWGTFILPRVSASDVVVAAAAHYKHWRLRATSAFLGTCGSSTAAFFWKLGLYRDVATANADQFGISSDNYVQQQANVLKVAGPGALALKLYTANNTIYVRGAMFISKGDWTDTQSIPGGAVPVKFDAETACMQITLDVVGTIGALRFPDYMYYDADVRGGTFILEASADVADTPAAASWTTMVASTDESPPRFLGREGTMAPDASGLAGSVGLARKVFAVQVAPLLYTWPTALGALTTSGALTFGSPTACAITLSGAGWSPTSNTKDDFSVHLASSGSATYWTPGTTRFNGRVSGYDSASRTLQFIVTPDAHGSCVVVVFVRSGEGTGVLSPNGPLVSSTTVQVTTSSA